MSIRTMILGFMAGVFISSLVATDCVACHWLRACYEKHHPTSTGGPSGAPSPAANGNALGDPVVPGAGAGSSANGGGNALGDPVVPASGTATGSAGTGAAGTGTAGTGTDSAQPPPPIIELPADADYDNLDAKIGKIRLMENQGHMIQLLILPQADRAAYVKKHGLDELLSDK